MGVADCGLPDAHGLVSMKEQADKYLIFQLRNQQFGTNVVSVQEILSLPAITPVPLMPEYLRGVINLRGKVLPVIELSLRLGMTPEPYTDRACIIVCDNHLVRNDIFGIIVDAVSEVVAITRNEIDTSHGFSAGIPKSHIVGLARTRNQVTTLLRIEDVLNDVDLSSIVNVV